MTIDASGAEGGPVTVHQALFGYAAGHGLLAASQPLGSETEKLLARLTDDTGAAGVRDFDGYLSGFPLPDGRYALVRTWNAPEAPRRGSVWSHALLLSAEDRPTSFQLMRMFQRPNAGQQDLKLYQQPRPIPAAQPTTHQIGAQSKWAEALFSQLMESPQATAWTVAANSREAEECVLALWDWLWPVAQRSFSFCLGATGPRRGVGGPFQLLVVPHTFRRSAALDLGPQAAVGTAQGRLLTSLLERPQEWHQGPTRFCAFAGAETGEFRAVPILLRVWYRLALTVAPTDVDTFREVAEDVAVAYPIPQAMRRLKRLLIVPQDLLPVPWTTQEIGLPLANSPLASATLALDADMQALQDALVDDPVTLIDLATRTPVDTAPDTVLAALCEAAPKVLVWRAQPTWLPAVSERNPYEARRLLAVVPPRQRKSWADTFWTMPSRLCNEVLTPGAIELSWLLAYNPHAGQLWLRRHARDVTPRMVVALLRDVGQGAPNPDLWVGALPESTTLAVLGTSKNSVQVEDNLLIADELTALLALANPSDTVIREQPLRTWRAASFSVHPLGPCAAAHLMQLLPSERPGKTDVMLSASAYTAAWAALADNQEAVWHALGRFPADLSSEHQWDRARRLARAYASRLIAWDRSQAKVPATQVAAAAARRYNPDASAQLVDTLRDLLAEEEQRQDKPSSKRKKRSFAEQAWDVAQEVIGVRWR